MSRISPTGFREGLLNNQQRVVKNCPPIYPGVFEECQVMAHRLPLSHATGAATFLRILQTGALLSFPKLVEAGLQKALSGNEASIERILGTEEDVFTYAAPFRYPRSDCGFLFKATVESETGVKAVATPFDSGATIHFLRRGDSRKEQIAFLRSHELPVPEYRQLMAHLLASCFSVPWDYVEGRDPDATWPIAVEAGDLRRWTFEVRFRDTLRLSNHLQAVFLAIEVASSEAALPYIEQWEAEGVDIQYVRSSRDGSWRELQNQCIEYLKKYLI